MKRTLLIGVAALACACGGSRQPDNRDASAPAGSAQAGSASAAAPNASGDQGGATRANQTVTLVGCLVGPGQSAEPTGTSGARARTRATGPETTSGPAGGSATAADRFMLVDAVVPGAELGGVGANGAGGSGGPLVSGRATFELDGIPADARNSVNKQVKVVGRLDARPAGASDDTNGAAAGAAGTSGRNAGASSGSSGSGVGSPTATGGGSGTAATAGSGTVPSGSSDAPGAHGNGQKSVAGHGTMGSAARSDLRNQRLVVETVQVIAETCAQR
jgi:hypothetical protein